MWLGNGDGTFSEKKPTPFNGGSRVWAPYVPYGSDFPNRAYDVNGDGAPDVHVPRLISYASGTGTFSLNLTGGYFTSRLSGDFVPTANMDLVNEDPANFFLLDGDFNGDGLADVLAASPSQSSFMSRGDGNGGYRGYSLEGVSMYPGWSVDLNGDGRTDIIATSNSSNRIYITHAYGWPNENGSNSEYASSNLKSTPLKRVRLEGYSGESWEVRTLMGNFSGSGLLEFLVMNVNPGTTPNKLYVRESLVPIDMLESVTNEQGLKTTYKYEPITKTTRYASDRGTPYAGSYPLVDKGARPVTELGPSNWGGLRLRDSTPSMFVVTSVTSDSGVGTQTVKTEMAYRGFKSDVFGRGAMGFREIRREAEAPDGVSKITTVEQRLQLYPYTGSAAVTESYLGPMSPVAAVQTGQLLHRTENVYCDQSAAAGAENTASVAVPCPTTSKIFKPYLRRSVQTGSDLNGTPLPVVTTTNTFAGGYPTLVETQTVGFGPAGQQTFVKRQEFEYWPDNIAGDNWLIGLVKKSTVSNTVPNSLGSITTSAGSAPKATATSGQ